MSIEVRRFLLQVVPSEDSHVFQSNTPPKDLLERSEHFLGFLHVAKYNGLEGSPDEHIAEESFLLLDAVATKKLQDLYASIEEYDREAAPRMEAQNMQYMPTLQYIPLTSTKFPLEGQSTTFLWFDRDAEQHDKVFTSFTLDVDTKFESIDTNLAELGVANVRLNDQLITNSLFPVKKSNIDYTILMMIPWSWQKSMAVEMILEDVISPIELMATWFKVEDFNTRGPLIHSMLKCFFHGHKTLSVEEQYKLSEVAELKSNVTKTMPCLLASAWYQTMKMALLTSNSKYEDNIVVYSCGPLHRSTRSSKKPTSMLSYAVATDDHGGEVERYTLSMKNESDSWTFSHKYAVANKQIYHDVYKTAKKALVAEFQADLAEAGDATISDSTAKDLILDTKKWKEEGVWFPVAYIHPMLRTFAERFQRRDESTPPSTARTFLGRLLNF